MLYKRSLRGRYVFLILLFLFVFMYVTSSQVDESGQRVERGFSFVGFKQGSPGRVCYITESGTFIPLFIAYSEKIIDKGFTVIITSHVKKIFYSRRNWTDDEPKYNIYSIDTLKDETLQLTRNDQGYDIILRDVSPDGNKILFTEFLDDILNVCVMGSEGENRTILDTVKGVDHGYIFCRWLNNTEIIYDIGDYYIYNRGSDTENELVKINVKSKNKQVLYSGSVLGRWGDLSRDGKLIFENSDKKDGYFDTTSLKVYYFTLDPKRNSVYTWAPDSKTIIFCSKENENKNLYLMDISTSIYEKIISISSEEIVWIGWINRGKGFVFAECDYNFEGNIYKVDVDLKTTINLSKQTGYMELSGMACPHIFAYNGSEFIKLSEIIGKNINKDNEKTETISISASYVHNNELVIRIEESLYEITYLNYINLKVGQTTLPPLECPPELKKIDDSYLVLKKGDVVELKFSIQGDPGEEIYLECCGYYEPLY